MKNINKILGKSTELIVFSLGSWWSVALHAVWFFLWFYLRLDLLVLTVAVSLEAIFLCLFILMVEKKEEERRQKKEEKERKVQKDGIYTDIALDESQKRSLSEIKKELKEIKGLLQK